MTKPSKASCSKAGRSLATRRTSKAGKDLANCRWKTSKKTKHITTRPKPKTPPRRSKRLAKKTSSKK